MSDPTRIYLFLDAARLPESVLAHELGHLWIELVEGLEDYRVLEDLSDSVGYSQVQMLQSFVLDRLVNRFLFDQGFDLKEIEEDRSISISQLALTASKGHCPKNLWERVTMATLLAEEDLDRRQVESHLPVRESLTAIKDAMPDVWDLSRDLIGVIEAESLTSPDAVKRCVDRVLTLCFTFAEEHLNIENELIERRPVVESFDKQPSWLPGLSPEQKCEVGKVMAQHGLDPGTGVRLFTSESGQAHAAFEGSEQFVPLPFFLRPPTHNPQYGVRPNPMHKPNPIAMPKAPTGPAVPNFPTAPKPPVPMPGRRSYSTGLARWITQVRLEEMLGGESPYGYAYNNPTTYTDPSGNAPPGRPPKRSNKVRALFCTRPVDVSGHDTGYNHWFLEVPGCGSMGYGPETTTSHGLINNYPDNSNNLPIDKVHCRPFTITKQQAACLCHLKSLLTTFQSSSGSTVKDPYQRSFCRPWGGKCYDMMSNNCQDFVTTALNHCGLSAPKEEDPFPVPSPWRQ